MCINCKSIAEFQSSHTKAISRSTFYVQYRSRVRFRSYSRREIHATRVDELLAIRPSQFEVTVLEFITFGKSMKLAMRPRICFSRNISRGQEVSALASQSRPFADFAPVQRQSHSHHICLNRVALVVQLCWIYLLFLNLSPLQAAHPKRPSSGVRSQFPPCTVPATCCPSGVILHQPRMHCPPNIRPLPSSLPTRLPRTA